MNSVAKSWVSNLALSTFNCQVESYKHNSEVRPWSSTPSRHLFPKVNIPSDMSSSAMILRMLPILLGNNMFAALHVFVSGSPCSLWAKRRLGVGDRECPEVTSPSPHTTPEPEPLSAVPGRAS